MRLKTAVLKKFYVATLLFGLCGAAAGSAKATAWRRDKPDVSHKPDLLHKLENSIANLQKKLDTLNASVKALNSNDNALVARVKALDANVIALTGKVNNAEGSQNSLNASVNALSVRVANFEAAAPKAGLLWISHLDARPREAHGLTTSNGTPIGATSGFVIRPTTAGTDRVLEQGLQVPPGFAVKRIAICYQVSNVASFISHIKLTQLNGPDSYSEVLNDPGDKTSTSATCVDSMDAPALVDPNQGPVRLNLGVTFTSMTDLIMIRAIGLYLEPIGF
jgi:hypothetical protein